MMRHSSTSTAKKAMAPVGLNFSPGKSEFIIVSVDFGRKNIRQTFYKG
jgi:hypothetical protein